MWQALWIFLADNEFCQENLLLSFNIYSLWNAIHLQLIGEKTDISTSDVFKTEQLSPTQSSDIM